MQEIGSGRQPSFFSVKCGGATFQEELSTISEVVENFGIIMARTKFYDTFKLQERSGIDNTRIFFFKKKVLASKSFPFLCGLFIFRHFLPCCHAFGSSTVFSNYTLFEIKLFSQTNFGNLAKSIT